MTDINRRSIMTFLAAGAIGAAIASAFPKSAVAIAALPPADLPSSCQCGCTRKQWRVYFDERYQFCARGRSLAQAKFLAVECCIIEWLNQHPAPSASGRCARCGKKESAGAPVVPFGTEAGTHAWLHTDCWRPWHQARRAEAIEVLGRMGIRI